MNVPHTEPEEKALILAKQYLEWMCSQDLPDARYYTTEELNKLGEWFQICFNEGAIAMATEVCVPAELIGELYKFPDFFFPIELQKNESCTPIPANQKRKP